MSEREKWASQLTTAVTIQKMGEKEEGVQWQSDQHNSVTTAETDRQAGRQVRPSEQEKL